jgi:hypothetical protein
LVVWEAENEADILALGFTLQEIEDVLYNRRNDTFLGNGRDGSLQHCVTVGMTRTNKQLSVTCKFVCGNPLEVYPFTAHEV